MYHSYFTRDLRDPADVKDAEEEEKRQAKFEKALDEYIDRKSDEECDGRKQDGAMRI